MSLDIKKTYKLFIAGAFLEVNQGAAMRLKIKKETSSQILLKPQEKI